MTYPGPELGTSGVPGGGEVGADFGNLEFWESGEVDIWDSRS